MTSSARLFSLGLLLLLAAACNKAAAPAPVDEAPKSRIELAVTEDGFTPAKARVKVGTPVTLVVTRKVEKTCATEIVIKDYGVNQALPKDQPVEVTFTPKEKGNIHFACAMDMITGELVAE